MFNFLTLTTIALSAFSAANALVIPRAAVPASYRVDILEPYADYNSRYMAIGCQNQHGSAFFDTCCHPLKKGETVEKNRPVQCNPANVSSTSVPSSSVAQPSATPAPEDDGDCEDEEPTSSVAPSVTRAPAASSSKSAAPSSAPVNAAPAPPAPSSSAAAPSSSHVASSSSPAPPKETPTKATPASTKPAPSPAPIKSVSGGDLVTGGVATFFFQNGNKGACGDLHSDNNLIAAIDERRYGNSGNSSPLCGKQVEITNTKNGKSVTVTIADDCPTCNNGNSIDLSTGAFNRIATPEEGEVPIAWRFL
ncbi:unnamed protein product [Somion occarium]|uniref:RlpA-like protein double-psi beta-barrel domain-containing protein n=1 Tax=Somion occarium TaxID=3059160 RepID=A0ABP1DA18_9APHY